MNELLEKLKTVDKKILIGAGVGAAVLIIIIIAFIVGGGSEPSGNKPAGGSQNNSQNSSQNNSQKDTEKDKETEDGVTEVFGETENEPGTEVLGTEMETEGVTEMPTEIGTEIQTPESESQSESQAPSESQPPSNNGGGNNGGGNNGGGNTTVNPDGEEIIGQGDASNPYMEIPDLDNMTVTTVNIPAGKTLYYGIQRVGGMWLTIKDPNAYVIESNGTRHDAKNGVVEFKVEDALASDYVMLQIGNKGGSPASFKISFGNVKGSYQNPEKISTVGTFNKYLAAGNEVGYYYKYNAEQAGTLRFYVTGTEKSGISVTNNRNSMNRTTQADVLTDEQGREYIELEVSAGDELIILIHAEPKRGKYPATDITWEMLYK